MQLPTPGDFLTQTFLDVRPSVALDIALGKWNLPASTQTALPRVSFTPSRSPKGGQEEVPQILMDAPFELLPQPAAACLSHASPTLGHLLAPGGSAPQT